MIVDDWKKASKEIKKIEKTLFYFKGGKDSPLEQIEIPYWNHSRTTIYFTDLIKKHIEKLEILMNVCVLILDGWDFKR